VRRRLARAKAASSFEALPRARTPDEKGRVLESLLAALFSGERELEIAERRYSTGDEEIDLIVKNNVDRPFWHALDSPLIFIECKNWSTPVGAAEIRDFEGKMTNHAPLCRVALFVAARGFTSDAFTQLVRASRDHVLVLVDLGQVGEFIRSGKTLIAWLKELIVRIR
jgi:restriction endonuclease Mrr